MSLFEKRNINVPNLNIESFGIYWRSSSWSAEEHFDKYFIASLVFDVKSLFKEYKKTVYIPILFDNEKEISDLMAYYNDIYFNIEFRSRYGNAHYSDLYHISNLVDIEKIYKTEFYKSDYAKDGAIYYINLVIKNYKGYDIVLNISHKEHTNTIDVESLCSENNDKDCLSLIKEKYFFMPSFLSYSSKNLKTTVFEDVCNFDTLEKMIKKIDAFDKSNKDREKKLDSMYSKKTFKLVED